MCMALVHIQLMDLEGELGRGSACTVAYWTSTEQAEEGYTNLDRPSLSQYAWIAFRKHGSPNTVSSSWSLSRAMYVTWKATCGKVFCAREAFAILIDDVHWTQPCNGFQLRTFAVKGKSCVETHVGNLVFFKLDQDAFVDLMTDLLLLHRVGSYVSLNKREEDLRRSWRASTQSTSFVKRTEPTTKSQRRKRPRNVGDALCRSILNLLVSP